MEDLNDFYNAWQFLYNHPIFQDKSGVKLLKDAQEKNPDEEIAGIKVSEINPEHAVDSRFETCLDIDVSKVNPETGKIDDDKSKNTAIEVWLECGPWENPEDMKPEEIEMFPNGMATIDINLCCGAETFEKAIIQLAKLVLKKYGSYESDNDPD